MTSLVLFAVTAAAGVTSTAAAYSVKKAVEMYQITHRNRSRSITNRQALREIVEQDDEIDLDTDPLTGFRGETDES